MLQYIESKWSAIAVGKSKAEAKTMNNIISTIITMGNKLRVSVESGAVILLIIMVEIPAVELADFLLFLLVLILTEDAAHPNPYGNTNWPTHCSRQTS